MTQMVSATSSDSESDQTTTKERNRRKREARKLKEIAKAEEEEDEETSWDEFLEYELPLRIHEVRVGLERSYQAHVTLKILNAQSLSQMGRVVWNPTEKKHGTTNGSHDSLPLVEIPLPPLSANQIANFPIEMQNSANALLAMEDMKRKGDAAKEAGEIMTAASFFESTDLSAFDPFTPIPLKTLVRERADTSLFEIKDSPGKGKGLFLTRSIAVGTMILNEEPIFESRHDLNAIRSTAEYLKPLGLMATYLSLSEACAYAEIENPCKENSILRVYNSNAIFAIDDDDDDPDESESKMGRVYQWAGRINHGCEANTWGITTSDGRIVLWATRDLKAGEEIFVSYCGSGTASERKYMLKRWEIECRCEKCEAGLEVTAPRRFPLADDSTIMIERGRGEVVIERSQLERKMMDEVVSWCEIVLKTESALDRELVDLIERMAEKEVALGQLKAVEAEEMDEIGDRLLGFYQFLCKDDIFGSTWENVHRQPWKRQWIVVKELMILGLNGGLLTTAQGARRDRWREKLNKDKMTK